LRGLAKRLFREFVRWWPANKRGQCRMGGSPHCSDIRGRRSARARATLVPRDRALRRGGTV